MNKTQDVGRGLAHLLSLTIKSNKQIRLPFIEIWEILGTDTTNQKNKIVL